MKTKDHGWCPGGSQNAVLNPLQDVEKRKKIRCSVCNKLLLLREWKTPEGESAGWRAPPHKAKKKVTATLLAKARERGLRG